MKKVTLFAAAAAVSALIATPVLAQDYAKPRAAKQMQTKQMKTKPMKHASKPMKQQARADRASNRVADQDRRGQRDTGFWPGAVVAGAVGTAGAVAATAVGTAGAIATAPFGGPYRDSYAYGPGYVETYSYNGIAMPYSSNYSARNGFMCEPGTFIKGTRNVCQ
ncbi:hypothetical protein YH63_004505 [Afipia massiliensis]|uniref:Uncharacterized protein n=1 Tax=Afipia massiliensis TaxID=211460 RepID=A0A4U6BKK5_9BRAD|nr:hypothetical protein [Afipia massiliensis]TKT70732.1 hypothetical protein YH63_004505 [Afipia massiliensis]